MSTESSEWLNRNVLIGFTDKRGRAWHYRKSEQGQEPNHYSGPIPLGDVERRLFAWEPVEASVQAVVSDRVADQLLEALDLQTRLQDRLAEADDRLRQRLGDALDLPDVIVRRLQNTRLGLESLAPMIAAGVETRIREAVTTSALPATPAPETWFERWPSGLRPIVSATLLKMSGRSDATAGRT